MAFCGNCGKEISDHASFCRFCGAKVNPPIEQKPIKEKKPVNKKIILLIVLAVVVAAAAITAGFLIKRANDKKKVAQAIKNARQHFEEMEYDKAIDDLALAIRIDPNNPDARMILARSYEETGDTEKAEENFKKALAHQEPADDKSFEEDKGPSDDVLAPYLYASKFYVSIGDFDAAGKADEDGISLIPEKVAAQVEKLSTEELIDKGIDPDDRTVKEQLFTMRKDLRRGYYEYYYAWVVSKSVDDTNPYGENTRTDYSYEYDTSGRLFRITGHINGGDTDVMLLSYDDEGHLTGVTSSKKNSRVERTYDDNGILKSVETEENGQKTKRTYHSKDGNITSIEDGQDYSKSYKYKNGRVFGISVKDHESETELKIREEEGLIVEISAEGKKSATCEYDEYGNLTKISDPDNILGEGAGTKTYEYKQIRVRRGSWEPNEYSNPTVTGIITRAQRGKIKKQTGHKGYEDRSKDPAEVTKELSAAKEAAIKDLETYKKPDAYRAKQQEELKSMIESGKKSIQRAMTKQEIDSALAGAKKAIDTIKTDAQLKADEEKITVNRQLDALAGLTYGQLKRSYRTGEPKWMHLVFYEVDLPGLPYGCEYCMDSDAYYEALGTDTAAEGMPFADSDKQHTVGGKASDVLVNFRESMTAKEFSRRFGSSFTSGTIGYGSETLEFPYKGRRLCFMMDTAGPFSDQTMLSPDMNVQLVSAVQ